MQSSPVLASAVLAVEEAIDAGAVAEQVRLVPFRAVYDLGLGEGTTSSALTSISGRLVYEMKGSACAGYAMTQRLVSRTELAEGQLVYEDVQQASFEDQDSQSFRFVTRVIVDDELNLTTKGLARRTPEAVNLLLSEPESESKILSRDALFPVAYLENLISRLEKGDRFFNALLFDGSDEGNRLFRTTVSAGQAQFSSSTDGQPFGLQGLRSWPVTVTYFDDDADRANMEPDYTLSATLYENGVSASLEMSYQGFSMVGQLVDLTLYEPSDCALSAD